MTGPTIAIVQARLSSSRLPGKVLAELGGRPMLDVLLARLARARRLDGIVVATSAEAGDDPLAAALAALGHRVVRGPLDDVLARFAVAARETGAARIVRVTGDCPLIDPALVDAVIGLLDDGADYACNTDPPSYPDGLDVEAFTRAALDRAVAEARLPSEREHVTSWMRTPAAGLRRRSQTGPADLSALRWTVDHADDLAFVRAIVDRLGAGALTADLYDCLRAHAAVIPLTCQGAHARNEGYAASLIQDRAAGRQTFRDDAGWTGGSE